jgi:transposase
LKGRWRLAALDFSAGALAVQMALLPAHAPDLNPVEYLWA